MNTTFPDLRIETIDGGNFRLSQQDFSGNECAIDLHPAHVRYLAERLDLIPKVSPTSSVMNATLTRRLGVLQYRLNHLENYMRNHSDHKHADYRYETDYCTATSELADEFIADLIEPMQSPGLKTNLIQKSKSQLSL